MSNEITIDDLRLIGVPGSNKVMGGELSRLARRTFTDYRLPQHKKEGQGALAYPFDPRLAALAVTHHRTSSRVLWSLFRSKANRLEPLYDDLFQAMCKEKRPWFSEGKSISISPVNMGRFEAGGRQVVGVVKNAIINGAAFQGVTLKVNPDHPDIALEVRMYEELVTVSIDLAGRPMNQRGYRTERGVAPLRENIAAMMVMLARHDARSEALVDPMAGSGTIPIEAACMAQGRGVWVSPREPLAKRLPPFEELLARPGAPLFGDTRPFCIANELEQRTYVTANQNIQNAGVHGLVETRCGDFQALERDDILKTVEEKGLDPARGVILSNPPYGERLSPSQLLLLYRNMGEWCRQFIGWRAGLLVANPGFEDAFGGKPRIKKPLNNGPLKGYFYLYDL